MKVNKRNFLWKLIKHISNDTIPGAMAIVLSLKHEKERGRKFLPGRQQAEYPAHISTTDYIWPLIIEIAKKCLWKIDSNRALLNMHKNLMRSSRFLSQNRSGKDSQIKRTRKVFRFSKKLLSFSENRCPPRPQCHASTPFHLGCQTSLGKDVLESVSDLIFIARSVQLPVNVQFYHLLFNAYANVVFQSATYFNAVTFLLVHLLSFLHLLPAYLVQILVCQRCTFFCCCHRLFLAIFLGCS